jgi:hypothetical protein
MGGNRLLIHCEQLVVLHQNFAGGNGGGDHALVKTEDDLPGQIVFRQRGMRMVIHKNKIGIGARRQDPQARSWKK